MIFVLGVPKVLLEQVKQNCYFLRGIRNKKVCKSQNSYFVYLCRRGRSLVLCRAERGDEVTWTTTLRSVSQSVSSYVKWVLRYFLAEVISTLKAVCWMLLDFISHMVLILDGK